MTTESPAACPGTHRDRTQWTQRQQCIDSEGRRARTGPGPGSGGAAVRRRGEAVRLAGRPHGAGYPARFWAADTAEGVPEPAHPSSRLGHQRSPPGSAIAW
jgi:hypothetical protein